MYRPLGKGPGNLVNTVSLHSTSGILGRILSGVGGGVDVVLLVGTR